MPQLRCYLIVYFEVFSSDVTWKFKNKEYRESSFRWGVGGTLCRSWLKYCATSRKVAGSIPDCVIGIFH